MIFREQNIQRINECLLFHNVGNDIVLKSEGILSFTMFEVFFTLPFFGGDLLLNPKKMETRNCP